MDFLVDIAKASIWAVNALLGSATGGKVGMQELPAKVVLVPPLFERDLRLRSRMAHSSYDHLFSKPAMRWLLTDYVSPGGRAWLHFRPAEDPRISVSANLSGSGEQLGRDSTGTVTLRYQPESEDPLTFFDIRAAARVAAEGSSSFDAPNFFAAAQLDFEEGGGDTRARACVFHQASGVGVWAVSPLLAAAGSSGGGGGGVAQLGLRYSTPSVTAGIVLGPRMGAVKQLWLGARNGSITAGVQSEPAADLRTGDLQQLWGPGGAALSYCLAYSPVGDAPYATAAGRGSFTAAVEVKHQRQLLVSFLYHVAVQRNVKNPFETADVVGITNYIDVGLQVATDVAGPSPSTIPGSQAVPAGSAALGLAWQVNKSVLVKARVSTESAGAALALKSWWMPSSVAALSCTYPFGAYSPYPKLGFSFGCENHGGIRYERSKDKMLRGSSVVQRHVAQPLDVAIHAGKGITVPVEDMDDPAVLGQMRRPSDKYL